MALLPEYEAGQVRIDPLPVVKAPYPVGPSGGEIIANTAGNVVKSLSDEYRQIHEREVREANEARVNELATRMRDASSQALYGLRPTGDQPGVEGFLSKKGDNASRDLAASQEVLTESLRQIQSQATNPAQQRATLAHAQGILVDTRRMMLEHVATEAQAQKKAAFDADVESAVNAYSQTRGVSPAAVEYRANTMSRALSGVDSYARTTLGITDEKQIELLKKGVEHDAEYRLTMQYARDEDPGSVGEAAAHLEAMKQKGLLTGTPADISLEATVAAKVGGEAVWRTASSVDGYKDAQGGYDVDGWREKVLDPSNLNADQKEKALTIARGLARDRNDHQEATLGAVADIAKGMVISSGYQPSVVSVRPDVYAGLMSTPKGRDVIHTLDSWAQSFQSAQRTLAQQPTEAQQRRFWELRNWMWTNQEAARKEDPKAFILRWMGADENTATRDPLLTEKQFDQIMGDFSAINKRPGAPPSLVENMTLLTQALKDAKLAPPARPGVDPSKPSTWDKSPQRSSVAALEYFRNEFETWLWANKDATTQQKQDHLKKVMEEKKKERFTKPGVWHQMFGHDPYGFELEMRPDLQADRGEYVTKDGRPYIPPPVPYRAGSPVPSPSGGIEEAPRAEPPKPQKVGSAGEIRKTEFDYIKQQLQAAKMDDSDAAVMRVYNEAVAAGVPISEGAK